MTDAIPTHQIVIDLNRECTQKQYAERSHKSLQQVSNEIRDGKLHVREIPELGLRLVQTDVPLFSEELQIESSAPLYTYNGKDLAYFLSKVMNDYVRMGQEWDKMVGERDAALLQAETLLNEVTSLNETVNQLHGTMNEVNSQNEAIKRANGDLSSQLGEARAKNSRMSQELTAAQNEQKRLREQVVTLEHEREQQDKIVSALQEDNRRLIDQLFAAQGEVKELQVKASYQEQEAARLLDSVYTLTQARLRLEGELATERRNRETADQEVAIQQQEIEGFIATNRELLDRAAAAEREVITLQERIKAAGQLNPEELIKQLTELMREEVARQIKSAVGAEGQGEAT